MSLFRNQRKPGEKLEPWRSYEMEPFEPEEIRELEEKNEFLCIGKGAENKQEFIPFESCIHGLIKENEADKGFNDIQEKVTRLEQEAYDKGFVQGEKDGFESGEEKAIKQIENIEKLFHEISSLKYDILKQYESELSNLIFAIAEKIVYHEVKLEGTIIKDAIIDSLDLAVEKKVVTIHVNPEDYEYVEKLKPGLFDQYKSLKSIIVTCDPSISRGGCSLETPFGNINATIESTLENVSQLLKEKI